MVNWAMRDERVIQVTDEDKRVSVVERGSKMDDNADLEAGYIP